MKCELYNDSFQNWKSYQIQKAQLIIADIPYNLGDAAYGSNPMWYVGGDNKNGESDKAKSTFFTSDGYFRISEYFMFCARLMKPEPKNGKGGAPCMIVFCAYQQQGDVIRWAADAGFVKYIPLVFIKNYSPQVLKANMKIVGATEYALVLYRDRLPKFNNDGQMIFNWMPWERDGADVCVCAYEGSPLKGDYRFRTNAEIRAGYLPRVFGYSFDDVRAWYSGRPLFADREMAGVWRMAFRRGLVENVRFDETIELYEDAMFVSEALLRARSMTCVAQEIYRVTSRDDGAMRSIPRDGARLCRNKLRLLAKRRALDVAEGGSLGPLYAASCVFSALEILSCTVRGRLPRCEGMRILREYLADPFVRSSVREFPLSLKKPLLASAVLALRLA